MKAVTPRVEVVGYTRALIPNDLMPHTEGGGEQNGERLIEFAGRLCYMSFHKPNPATAATGDYIRNIISQRHYSVLEHVSVSFYLAGVSRNFSHELVRHRHFSFSELSGRYVDPFKAGLGYVAPVLDEGLTAEMHEDAEVAYYDRLDNLAESGVKGKRAKESARAVIPGSVETRLVITGNLRSWLEFVSKRDHPAADAEMQNVAHIIYEKLLALYPDVFEGRGVWDSEWSQSAPK